ncbi:copper resistance CopC/CopD family protein [Mycolicibacterium sp. CBMA 234]|uniref:copper resistance CopC/CopD family protein n=1 Tax=Mycolicibacterium sp. CBMA 234 TaxID=1918495 RepID=UPI0012DEA676|nr:copper resistance protein CopC [Mycolicibacterium sp. CBMA 234]
MRSVAALPVVLLAALLAVLLPTLTAAPAYAHAVLVYSDPVDGTTLPSAPTRVTLTFDEAVRLIPAAVQVISESGSQVDRGVRLQPGNTTVELELPPSLPRGSYTATWRLISADGHEVSGSVTFGVQQAPDAPPQIHPVASSSAAADVARGLRYAGLVLCLGVLAACRLVWGWALALRRTRILAGAGWVLLAAATVIDTSATRAWLVALLGVAAVALVRGARAGTPLFVVVGAGLAVTIAASGHAAAGPDPWLATAVTTVHLVAMAVWLGGLCVLALVVLPGRRTDELQRWSRVAFGCVAAVLLSGEYQAWRQVSPIESLWSTGYGMALCAKVFLVTLMLGLAYLGRRRLTPERLRRTVPVETALAVLVLLVTTVLTGEPPARTTYGPELTATAALDQGRQAQVHLATTRRGAIPVDVTVVGGTRVLGLRGTLSSAEIASLPVRFTAGPDGRWHSTYATAPRPGLWTLQLTVQFGPNDTAVTSVPFRAW